MSKKRPTNRARGPAKPKTQRLVSRLDRIALELLQGRPAIDPTTGEIRRDAKGKPEMLPPSAAVFAAVARWTEYRLQHPHAFKTTDADELAEVAEREIRAMSLQMNRPSLVVPRKTPSLPETESGASLESADQHARRLDVELREARTKLARLESEAAGTEPPPPLRLSRPVTRARAGIDLA